MRSNLGIHEGATGTGPARNVDELKPRLHTPKKGGGREHKLGATARSFAILEHVASSRAPVDVLDIIASVKLPKATADCRSETGKSCLQCAVVLDAS
jgi:hypothetical protein